MTELHAVHLEPDPADAPTPLMIRAEVLESVRAFIRRYVVLSDPQADTVTLWIAHTYCIDAAQCTPYLHVSSAEKRSGKTRLLETVELLVDNPLRTADITEAALFHVLSEERPTILLDEIDTVFGKGKSREPLRALLNASYRRGSLVRRVRGGEVCAYDVFGPKMIAGIGDIPDTVADRSIPIRLERRTSGEHVERYRLEEARVAAHPVRGWLELLFSPTTDTVRFYQALISHRPDVASMDWLHDRAADSWEPLLCIADVVGEGWGDRARAASRELSGMDVRQQIADMRETLT